MKTQNVLKNGSLLILGLFITSMVWSNNMIIAVNDQETVELDTRGLPAGEYIGFLITNYGTFLESMTKKANIALGSGEDDDQ